jgi:hypothetical protein
VLECPVCGFQNPEDAVECGRCRLAAGLFEPVRSAVDASPDDPRYADQVRDVLLAVESEGGGPPSTPGGPRASELARLLSPARFPSTRPVGLPVPTAGASKLRPLTELPALPALPPGEPTARMRQQIDEYLALMRRQGLDAEPFHERVRAAVATGDREAFERLNREMFVHLASVLGDEFERDLARRHDLADFVAEDIPDAELVAARDALVLGDLAGAQTRLKRAGDTLASLEEEWTTVRILLLEATLLAETVRELGGDPTPALGPLDEGRRRALEVGRREAEPVLARAVLALWHVLRPRFARRLAELGTRAERAASRGVDRAEFDAARGDLASDLERHNFGAAVLAYRRTRDAVERMEHRSKDFESTRSSPPASVPAAPAGP